MESPASLGRLVRVAAHHTLLHVYHSCAILYLVLIFLLLFHLLSHDLHTADALAVGSCGGESWGVGGGTPAVAGGAYCANGAGGGT